MKRFLKNTIGNTSIVFALSIVPVLAAVGAGVDMARMNEANTLLQGAVDAASLAAATSQNLSKSNVLAKIVDDYLLANNAPAKLRTVTSVTQGMNAATGNYRVSIHGMIDTSFLSVVGITQIEVAASSEVNLGIQGLEVALVLDNTGSMAGSKIAALQTSAKSLISILETAKASYSDLKFGLVPFAQYVNVGTANAGQSWLTVPPSGWNGCVDSRPSPLDLQQGSNGGAIPGIANVNCPAPIEPLTNDTTAVNTKIDAMVAGGSTYIAGGLLWGWNVLNPDAPFQEGRTPAQMKAINGKKVAILMTDGTNTAAPSYPAHNSTNSVVADSNLAQVCDAVKADGIEIYTVLFEETNPVIVQLLQNCATAPKNAFLASSNQALIDTFTAIGKQLSDVRLAR